ncbi:MAG TPA: hypothetical protein VFW09_14830 [Solirubrobacteraceae bacterium]|nr:hypothetical protein [Solirubrobacteraceae bacterium]
MELALALNRLWHRRLLLALGIVVAVAVGILGTHALKKTTYSAASTQMVVDAPKSALGNLKTSLVPFTARAIVYSRLMTSPAALDYIGKAAGIPGNEISAVGPAEIGAPTAMHTPSVEVDGKLVAPKEKYVLRFDQNPDLPTVDIYAEAPSTTQAIALANGAVTGFASYIRQLDSNSSVPAAEQIQIRQLGAAEGGVVAGGSAAKLGALLGLLVFVIWCLGVLWVSRVREQMREPEPSGREVIDDFDEDMRWLLRARAAVDVGANGSNGHGADPNGGNGARVILPNGIDGDGDEEPADRPGSPPATDR